MGLLLDSSKHEANLRKRIQTLSLIVKAKLRGMTLGLLTMGNIAKLSQRQRNLPLYMHMQSAQRISTNSKNFAEFKSFGDV